jgi:hypothetical protein
MKRLVLAAVLLAPLACVDAPKRSDAADQPSKSAIDADTPVAAQPEPTAQNPGSTELSAEELALIDADPSTLTREQNRKRAYALRKKVMQNPDSPQARALEDAREAALNGELPPEQVTPETETAEPEPAAPGLVIELPPHLQGK